MRVLKLITFISICNIGILCAPTTTIGPITTDEIETSTIEDLIIDTKENEIDGKLLKEEISTATTTMMMVVEPDILEQTGNNNNVDDDENLVTENILKSKIDESTTNIGEESTTAKASTIPLNYIPMTQQNDAAATSQPLSQSDLMKMRVIQHYREVLRAHVFRALFAMLNEMKRRKQESLQRQQFHQNQATLESQIVETRTQLHSSAAAGNEFKWGDEDNATRSDNGKVIVYDGNLRKYVYIDRDDLLPEQVSSHRE